MKHLFTFLFFASGAAFAQGPMVDASLPVLKLVAPSTVSSVKFARSARANVAVPAGAPSHAPGDKPNAATPPVSDIETDTVQNSSDVPRNTTTQVRRFTSLANEQTFEVASTTGKNDSSQTKEPEVPKRPTYGTLFK